MKIIITMEDGLLNSVEVTEPCEVIVQDISDLDMTDEPHHPYLQKPFVGAAVITKFEKLKKEIEEREKSEG